MSQTESMNPNGPEESLSQGHEHTSCSCLQPYPEPKFCCESAGEGIENSDDQACCESESEGCAPEAENSGPDASAGERTHDKKPNPHLEAFLVELNKHTDPQTKLQMTLDFMESSLSQNGTPHFKSFWDARNICLELFKENILPAVRAQLWTKYSELSKEARRLKAIFDEQSAFAAEQIEIAIKALEDDIVNFTTHLDKISPVDFEVPSQTLKEKGSFYQEIQRHLNLLNTQAARINALRKELIRTEMRVRQKNKFFQRLSSAGDHVFPKRKDLIKDISDHFLSDIDAFIAEFFAQGSIEDNLYFLREEIKALQGMAKLLTLNTHSFTHTRLRLSECWDKIKLLEKERKKERAVLKATFKHNVDAVLEKIQSFTQAFPELSVGDANKRIEEITSFMRSVELGREEVKFLRDELSKARQPLLDKIQAADLERQNQEIERDRQKKKKVEDIRTEIEELIKNSAQYDADKINADRTTIMDKIQALPNGKTEKIELERLLKPLRDIIAEKKEQALMSLSDDDKQALQQLKELLSQRKERRQEIKAQLEASRKSSVASGLDFVQAMSYNAQIQAEQERLEKINEGVKEIEHKIFQLQKKI